MQNVNEHPDDRIGKEMNIYNVSWWQVFSRNVVAGMGRAIGGLIVSAAVFIVVGFIVSQTVLPMLQPLVDTYMRSLETLQQFTNGAR